jgi:uncharacterized membrane protein YccC
MFGMAISSAKLFAAGKLFKDTPKVMRQLMLGMLAGVIVGVIIGQFAPLWVAAIVAGAVSGFAQPMLFKDLKYA